MFFATDFTKQEPQPPENRRQPASSGVCMTSHRRPLHSIDPGLSACVCRTVLCPSHHSVINAFLKWCIVKITYLYIFFISILTSHRFSFALCCYFSRKINISQDQSFQSAAWLSNAALMWPLPDPHLSFCLSSSLSFTVQSPRQELRFTNRLTCCGSCPLVWCLVWGKATLMCRVWL